MHTRFSCCQAFPPVIRHKKTKNFSDFNIPLILRIYDNTVRREECTFPKDKMYEYRIMKRIRRFRQ